MALNTLERVCFNPRMPANVNHWLQSGVDLYSKGQVPEAERCFQQALNESPSQLESYQAYYKLLATERRLDDALMVIEQGLQQVVGQLGLTSGWQQLTFDSCDWFSPAQPRFMLYTLKAYAFVQMRRGDFPASRLALDILSVCDPQDQVGSSVLCDLLTRLEKIDEYDA